MDFLSLLIGLLAIKMRFQFGFGNVPRCLADYGFKSSFVQLMMGGNRKGLLRTVREVADTV